MTTRARLRRLRAEVDELVETHQNARDLTDFERYRGQPVAFMREELGFQPFPKQVEVAESFHAHKRVAVRGCHGAGKDAILAPLMLYAAYACRMLVLAISATERQLIGQLWREVGARFSPRLPGELYRNSLRIHGEERIVPMTSGSVSNLTGWHDPNGVFVAISESQSEQVESAAFDAAAANAVDEASRIMVVGNPVKPVGRFFEVHQKPTWRAIKISAFDHPNLQEGREVIPGGPSPTWPQEMAEEFGADSPWYVARVLAEFPETGIDSLVCREWIDRAFDHHREGRFAAWASNLPARLVADIARGGPDKTCVGTVRGPVVETLELWDEDSLMETARRLHARALELGRPSVPLVRPTHEQLLRAASRITVDDVGVGGGVTDRLKELKANVTPFNGAHRARNAERFANRRAEVYFDVREGLQRGETALPPDEMLAEELLATEYSVNSAGRIIVSPKEEIRSRLSPARSPDRADVVSMAVPAQRRNTVRVRSYIA